MPNMEITAAVTGYLGLLATSFLAATLFPLGSEALVAAMAVGGFAPAGVLLTATCGNVAGAVVNYLMGRWGRNFFAARRPGPPAEQMVRAQKAFNRWGAPVLFFSWAPVVGDALTVAAGVLRVAPAVFLFWVTLGKGLRYALIVFGVDLLGAG